MARVSRKASEDHLQRLRESRPRFLEKAREHAVLWLDTKPVGGKSSETRWLAGFSDPQEVSRDLIAAHKVAWSIQGVAGDPYPDMVKAIRQVISQRPDASVSGAGTRDWIAKRVSDLARDLGMLAVASMRPREDGKERTARHTSWASKILHHAWPDVRTFVWDTNARLALNTRVRHWLSDAASRKYGYRQFLDDCEEDLADLRSNTAFQAGLTRLIEERGSVLSDHCQRFAEQDESEHRIAVCGFLERRLYDKYLWVEGDFIRGNLMPG